MPREMWHETEQELEVITFDPWAIFCAQSLIENSTLHDKVIVTKRDALIGAKQVLEVRVKDLPVRSWSTGEQALWSFLNSVAGFGECSLHALRMHYRGENSTSSWIVALVVEMLANS